MGWRHALFPLLALLTAHRLETVLCEGPAGSIGGFYVDYKHAVPGTLAGIRMISAQIGHRKPSSSLLIIGSDDGDFFWSLGGSWNASTGDVVVDFTAKGGPKDLAGSLGEREIRWQNKGKQRWTRLEAPAEALVEADSRAHPPQEWVRALGGLFVDRGAPRAGHPLGGLRAVSAFQGHAQSRRVHVIGTDDGRSFWTLYGGVLDSEDGGLKVDFAPLAQARGAPPPQPEDPGSSPTPPRMEGVVEGIYYPRQGGISWADGKKWSKVAARAEDATERKTEL